MLNYSVTIYDPMAPERGTFRAEIVPGNAMWVPAIQRCKRLFGMCGSLRSYWTTMSDIVNSH